MPDPSNSGPKGSLFSVIYDHASGGRSRQARRENLEIGLGFLGSWTLVALIATVAAELRGRDALSEALVSALLVGLTYLVYRKWRQAGR
jgi:hypothetical protein